MSTIYARARAEIERRGWRQGPHSDPDDFSSLPLADDDPCCLVEGLQLSCGLDEDVWGVAREAALFHLWEHDNYDGSLMAWNDKPGRTVEQVYALLDQLDRSTTT